MPDKWMSIAAAAAQLGVHPRTIERRMASGKLQSSRTDEGLIQVLIELDESSDSAPTPLETVRELAHDQVTLATGSASAIVRLAQADADRARGELSLVRQEASRARQGALVAWCTVGAMCIAVFVAIGWTSHRVTRADDDIEQLRQTAARVEAEAKKLLTERDSARHDAEQTKLAGAEAAGKLAAIKEEMLLSRSESDNRPTTQPVSKLQRIASVIFGN